VKTERIEARFDGAVAYLMLNRPPVNVIDFSMIDEIKAFVALVRDEPSLCAIVLQGAGRVFSAGVDIPSHLPETVHAMIREVHSLFELLDDVAVPTVGLVRGRCLGGACELVGYLDYVLATDDASFGLPEIKLGVFPPAAAAFFPQRFGYQGAMRMLLTGESIGPEEAFRIGLVSRIVPDADAHAALEDALGPLRQRSAAALRMVKRASIRSRGRTFRELVAPSEAVYLDELMATGDAIEGLEAFIETRDPVWTHQ
jgi:cyclohexa-1,5-dienecarbonyl-CoA hydratase